MEKLVRPHISKEKNQQKMCKDAILKGIFRIAAVISGGAIAVIVLFVFLRGVQPFLPGYANGQVNFIDFLFGTTWRQDQGIYGAGFIIINTLITSFGALIISFPISVLTALFIVKIAPKWLAKIMTAIVEMLASIPSVVYGFFGIVVLVPMVRALGEKWDGSGNSMLTASILLAIMILPTIIGVVEPALRAVPRSDYEGALALGATHERSVYTAVVPAARSGILAGVVLGVGRAMGETMAVIMVAGNQPRMPKGILQGVRTLTGNIVIEMGYAAGLHREALIATGVVLFVFILLMNLCFSMLKRGKKA